MGTSKIQPPRARSLADDLRLRSDDQLHTLLALRPDLLHPVPADISQLAVRATTTPSVSSVLDGLNRVELEICEVLAALPDPTSRAEVHNALISATNYESGVVDAALDVLIEQALVWGTDDDLHLVRIAREAFGAYPCGLGISYVDSKPTVAEYVKTPEKLNYALDECPADAREILQRLLWSTPLGSMNNATRRITKPKSTLEWLLHHEILIANGHNTVALPREISLLLREGKYLSTISTERPSLIGSEVLRADEGGAHAALEFVRLAGTLLEHWSLEPPVVLKSGGLAIRDLTLAGELLHADTHTTATVIEIVAAAGLLAADDEWMPTTTYDRWLGLDDASRWAALASAWRDTVRAPHLVGGEGAERINALSAGAQRPFVQQLRGQLLDLLANLPAGRGVTAREVTTYLDWLRPRRATQIRAEAIGAIMAEANLLGVTASGALTNFGRDLADGLDAQPALAALLPPPIDYIILQADLTALAPGRLPSNKARMLSVMADVESTGIASTYRFTEKSIRQALDLGQSATDITSFLTELSRTGLPQPLTYLIDDVARRHGALRVGVASVYLRCDDESLINIVQADRRLSVLRFRLIAPGVLVSAAQADIVLEKLRAAGYAPIGESAEGAVLIHRPDTKRTSGKAEIPPVRITNVSGKLVAAAIKSLRAGERITESSPNATAKASSSTTNTLAILNAALAENREVWIGYADKSGITTERIVEPLTIAGGFLTAFDVRTNEVKTFTIARITGAEFFEDKKDA